MNLLIRASTPFSVVRPLRHSSGWQKSFLRAFGAGLLPFALHMPYGAVEQRQYPNRHPGVDVKLVVSGHWCSPYLFYVNRQPQKTPRGVLNGSDYRTVSR